MEFETMTTDMKTPEFLKIPKFLLNVGDLSFNAILVYSFIYERTLSGANNGRFIDSNGDLFCYFSDEDLAQKINISSRTVRRALAELKDKKLIKRERTSTKNGKAITYIYAPKGTDKNVLTDGDSGQICPNLPDRNVLTYRTDLSEPIPYINKTKRNKNKGIRTDNVSPPEEPPKPKENSKAQEATKTIIEHWNEKFETKYSPKTKTTVDLVKALLKNNYTVDQILEVIDYKASTRRTEADYRWFVPATVLALKNFERNKQLMKNEGKKFLNDVKSEIKTFYGTQPNQGYRKNKIPESITLPEWYEVKESERANESDVKKILELQNSILKGA